MSDSDTLQGDDAPTSSATRNAAAQAAAELPEATGSSVAGRAVMINRPLSEVYAFYRDLSNAPTYMDEVDRVDMSDPKRPHWVAKAPGGKTVEWDAEITEERPDELIAWRSIGDGPANAGRAEFQAVEGRGTVVTLTLSYDPPGGAVGKLVAKLFQRDPAIQARRNLRRLKQLLETGEIATAASNRAALEKEDA